MHCHGCIATHASPLTHGHSLRDIKYCPCCGRVYGRDVLGALNIRAGGMHELAHNTGAWR
jgi:transposase